MRVLVADDSAIIVSMIKHLFMNDPEIVIANVAKNGKAAVELARDTKPDAIIMDINMPVMDGITATSLIAKETGVPVLVFSSEINETSTLKAYQAGAVEVLLKPDIDQINDPAFQEHFRQLVLGLKTSHKSTQLSAQNTPRDKHATIHGVVMGASTGGPKTVRSILAELPGDFPVGIALVQHMETGFESGYAHWLNESTSLTVSLINETTLMEPGHVYVAPADIHLAFLGNELILQDSEKVQNQKPAVDVLFQSAATAYGSGLLGVLLTGMGRDGADGCVEIVKHGGITIVQDAETSDIFGMPRAAIEQNGATYIEALPNIARFMTELCSNRSRE